MSPTTPGSRPSTPVSSSEIPYSWSGSNDGKFRCILTMQMTAWCGGIVTVRCNCAMVLSSLWLMSGMLSEPIVSVLILIAQSSLKSL